MTAAAIAESSQPTPTPLAEPTPILPSTMIPANADNRELVTYIDTTRRSPRMPASRAASALPPTAYTWRPGVGALQEEPGGHRDHPEHATPSSRE